MANRIDPFGEYDHIKPVPVEQAVKEIKDANIAVSQAINEYLKTKTAYLTAKERKELAVKTFEEKSYQLSLSALEE